MLADDHPDRIQIAFDDHRLVAIAGLIPPATLGRHLGLPELVDRHLDLVSRVNYICRLASISFAGSPPWPGRVAGQRWSGSWGRQTPG